MAELAGAGSRCRFGVFELHLQAGELRKRGIRVRLQEQPLQILTLLIECAGEVVTREQIQKKLWRDETFVDFDNAINGAVRKVRDAHGDTSESPRFVETVARRGYRYIAPVSQSLVEEAPAQTTSLAKAELVPSRARLYWLAGVLLVSLLADGGIVHWLKHGYTEPPTIETLTYSGRDSSPSMSPDGKTIAFSSDRDGIPRIWPGVFLFIGSQNL